MTPTCTPSNVELGLASSLDAGMAASASFPKSRLVRSTVSPLPSVTCTAFYYDAVLLEKGVSSPAVSYAAPREPERISRDLAWSSTDQMKSAPHQQIFLCQNLERRRRRCARRRCGESGCVARACLDRQIAAYQNHFFLRITSGKGEIATPANTARGFSSKIRSAASRPYCFSTCRRGSRISVVRHFVSCASLATK